MPQNKTVKIIALKFAQNKSMCIFDVSLTKNDTMELIHNTFGTGTLVSNDGTTIVINFEGIGEKSLIAKYAKLKNTDGTDYCAPSITTQVKKRRAKKQPTVSTVADNINTWKYIALSVNDKWNSNSTWKLAEASFGNLNAQGNEFIESLLNSMFSKKILTEKQAYYLAKFAVESGQLN